MLLLILPLLLTISTASASTAPSFYFTTNQTPAAPRCPAVQTFNDGNRYGPCDTYDGKQGVLYGPQSKYWAATFDGGSHCGETIVMTYQGKTMKLMVMDQCPGCGDGHVDMGLDALIELTGSAEAACAIDRPPVQVEWSYAGKSQSEKVSSKEANTGANTTGPRYTQSPLDAKAMKAARKRRKGYNKNGGY
jgi:hypothetical protein